MLHDIVSIFFKHFISVKIFGCIFNKADEGEKEPNG